MSRYENRLAKPADVKYKPILVREHRIFFQSFFLLYQYKISGVGEYSLLDSSTQIASGRRKKSDLIDSQPAVCLHTGDNFFVWESDISSMATNYAVPSHEGTA